MYLFILGLPKYDAYLPFVSPNSASLVINSGSWWQSKGVVTLTIPPLIRNPSNGYINPYFFGLMTIPYMEIMGFFGPEHIWIHLAWSLASNSATFSSSSWCLRDLNSGRTPKSRSTCCWFCQKKRRKGSQPFTRIKFMESMAVSANFQIFANIYCTYTVIYCNTILSIIS